MTDVWLLVRAERAAIVRDLEGLTDEQWGEPSLCAGWSVHDVAAHLVANAGNTAVGVVWAMVRARFDFDRQNDQTMRRAKGATPQETLQRLREVVGRRTGPPAPLDSRLVEEVLHGEDVRRQLGIEHAYAPEAVERALRYQVRTPVAVGGSKQIAAGVTLRSSDDDLLVGEGPEVTGPSVSLLMAVSGRDVALADLAGPGLDVLRSRVVGG